MCVCVCVCVLALCIYTIATLIEACVNVLQADNRCFPILNEGDA